MLFYLLPQRMHPNASWCFTPEHGPPPSRKHSRFSLFSANWGAGWHMFLPLAIALHTLDRHQRREQWERSPTASKHAHLLRMQLPNMQSRFKVRSRRFWPYLTSQHQRCRKKNKNVHMEVSSQCQVPDSVKVVRHAAMQLTHLSRDIQRHAVISKEIP